MFNKNIAIIAMGLMTGMTVTAQDEKGSSNPTPASDATATMAETHVDYTRRSIDCMKSITDALSKVKAEPEAAMAAQVIREAGVRLKELGKKQLTLPPITIEEQKQMNSLVQEIEDNQRKLAEELNRLQSSNLLTQDILRAIMELQAVEKEIEQSAAENVANAAPLPKDAEGNTQETLLADTIESMEILVDALKGAKGENGEAQAIKAIDEYRKVSIDIVTKQRALPPITPAQDAKMVGIKRDAATVARNLGEEAKALLKDPATGPALRNKLIELSNTIKALKSGQPVQR